MSPTSDVPHGAGQRWASHLVARSFWCVEESSAHSQVLYNTVRYTDWSFFGATGQGTVVSIPYLIEFRIQVQVIPISKQVGSCSSRSPCALHLGRWVKPRAVRGAFEQIDPSGYSRSSAGQEPLSRTIKRLDACNCGRRRALDEVDAVLSHQPPTNQTAVSPRTGPLETQV